MRDSAGSIHYRWHSSRGHRGTLAPPPPRQARSRGGVFTMTSRGAVD